MAEVVTRGSGEHEVVADQAELRVSFAADAADRATAVNLLATRLATVDGLVQRDGVQVRQRTVSVHSRWEGNLRVGSTAQQDLVLRITDLQVLDDLLAGLFSAEPAWLDGPHWRLVDESAALREAQRRAVADARVRAEAYAEALGGRLGALIRLADAGTDQPFPVARTVAFAAEAGRVGADAVRQLGLAPENVTVRATCTGTWALDA
jgi:uncharacterized protein YggE